ncbi:GPW/gp25 family protein [Devosia ginsengisoli]|uniref:GPW/gp25 family protein n=1 Tax=Devosia ginsengisoli TaxID=400770 RepID=UPI0026EDFE84|nr:GPW/gp25 family protein [Devosia ginsengisoli]MCR6673231.1 GPW/gp25 family protein [Devosia ginsengisoli]
MASDPSIDIDAATGANIGGWPHVLQCLNEIFVTRFGERVIREWFGSNVPRLLGEPMNSQTIVPFFAAIASAIDQWEPRCRVIRVVPDSVDRGGMLRVHVEVEYRPRALVGDFTVDGARRVTFETGSSGGLISNAAI